MVSYNPEITEIVIIEKEIFREIVAFLELERDASYLVTILKTLDIIFRNERLQDSSQFYLRFERMGGIDAVEALQKHKNKDVYSMCADLLIEFGEAEVVIGSAGNDG